MDDNLDRNTAIGLLFLSFVFGFSAMINNNSPDMYVFSGIFLVWSVITAVSSKQKVS